MINVAVMIPGVELQKHSFDAQSAATQVLEKLIPNADERASFCLFLRIHFFFLVLLQSEG